MTFFLKVFKNQKFEITSALDSRTSIPSCLCDAKESKKVPIIGAKLWPGFVSIAALPKKNAEAET